MPRERLGPTKREKTGVQVIELVGKDADVTVFAISLQLDIVSRCLPVPVDGCLGQLPRFQSIVILQHSNAYSSDWLNKSDMLVGPLPSQVIPAFFIDMNLCRHVCVAVAFVWLKHPQTFKTAKQEKL